MLQQNNFKRVGKKRSRFCPCFLAFEVFQYNIEGLGTSMGKKQQDDGPCNIALLVLLGQHDSSHDIFGKVPRDLLIIQLPPLSHFSASSLCCASKSASVLRALHLMAPTYISDSVCFYSFSPWSSLSDHFFLLLPSLIPLSWHPHVLLLLSYKVCLSSCYFIPKLADLLPIP